MTQEEKLLERRFCELAESTYAKGHYQFTDFLGLAELDLFYRAAQDFSYLPYTLFGGAEGCERVMVRLGDADTLGYQEPPFPITCLSLRPAAPKFAEPLSHRDCLGALMNVGITRECLGDICATEGGFILFCVERMADYICENVARVRHTPVVLARLDAPHSVWQHTKAERIQVQSPRADAILSRAYHLSRADSAALFAARRVYRNGRLLSDGSTNLQDGDLLTARGYGRLRYTGAVGQTKKGKLSAMIEIFT